MNALFARRILALSTLLAASSVAAWATITISPGSEQFPDVLVGQTFTQQFFSNGVGAVTWSISQGVLPPGLNLNASTGLISGQTIQGGPYAFVLQAASSTDSGTASYELNVQGSALTFNQNAFNPRAATGAPYSTQLQAYGGSPPYTWSLAAGPNNNGLSLSASGLLSGMAITPGVTTLNIVLTDSVRTTVTAQLTLLVMGITTSSLPPAAIGVAYQQTLTVLGAQLPVSWAVTGVTPLPPGFSLSSQGVLSGFPTTNGVYAFTVTVTDFIQNSASAHFTLVVGTTFTITTTSPLPDAAIGVNYSQVLQAAGGIAPFTWTASGVPPGLTLDASSGTLHGTPTSAGSQTMAVTVTDSTLAAAHASLALTVDPLSISTASLPSGVVGSFYSAALMVSGGQTSLVWSVSAGALPAGLALNSSSGAINGTPTAAGSFPFTVSVTYAPAAVTVTKQFTILISVASGLTISTGASLPAATLNSPYSQTLAAAGGRPPYTWALLSGTLPIGLSFSTNGAITGTPLGVGTANFTIGVTDSAQAFFNQAFSLTVLPSSLDFTSALRIAQVVDGGNFITQFAIVNLDALSVSYSARFWDDNGNPLSLPILNGTPGTLAGTLASGEIAFAQTTGTSAAPGTPALQGWAEIAASGRLGVTAIFHRSIAGTSDSEATVSGVTSSGAVSLPFDNTQGYATGVALANTNALQAITVTAVFEFENGGSYTTPIALPAHAHTAFVMPTTYSATAGLRGVVHFTAFSPDITVVGLRFSPNNSFTSLGSFQ
jgi:hypothetical protein